MSNPTSHSSVSFGTKLVRTFVRLLVTLIIVGLTALVVYLLSQENARTFTLHVVDDTLIINKGKFLPFGSSSWNPEDETYAPLALEGFRPSHIETSKYKDIVELDKALFPILESLIRPRILSEEPASQERGISYLHRAERLKGLSNEQQNSLKTLRAEASFYMARTRLPQAELFMRETVEQFKLATQTPNKNTQAAARTLQILEPALKQLGLAIQDALAYPGSNQDSPPAPAPPVPEPPVEPAPPPSEQGSPSTQNNHET